MDSVLARLPKQNDPNVLIGFSTADDAGVYQLTPDLALVQTVDFFTPIVDDPYAFGQIAAANSLSDIYAMGGKPVSALSIVGFPNTGRDIAILEQILQGGLSKMQEAGCTVIGGHSIGDEEIKFGYAVTGLVNPRRVWANATARVDDRLVLTKRIVEPEALRCHIRFIAFIRQGLCQQISNCWIIIHYQDLFHGSTIPISNKHKDTPYDGSDLLQEGCPIRTQLYYITDSHCNCGLL